ncbi:monovalent cation/H(+) antiporter subunit G [Bacillus subtilis]|jgi:multicomponent K+:H+ antiporter subunit G|uniref:monovalent cation/H(+) antiporter subunit G n=1 Tax=Pseudochrobactrum asaccharolyticum TaxID=354351 RepID=UPI000EFD4D5B|nr:monovalent cation/H(+) antiporter subunit G [Pseudochrobactrum asaccharolyticum]MBX8799721.1 cation:proton antiporter [Ochrobactrum sp. MR28]MBX8815529.1 cation:proton antiporter [Ochrobactrum sp. MR31]MCF7671822.1 monovalent cation/H(+) antiporter subunit G [Bacillus subtilis]MDR2311000.1 monovalent cation/H(+) antiporter subunit G [Brucellaceae bacterium]MCF7646938.1 monovalent cation/H(+) antiporter subunit G [Pseudochrobactrum asaccharolyticum]
MSHTLELPLWAAILVSVFLLAGSLITMIGAIGLVRFKLFYERIHAPTLGTTFGVGGILIASIIFFTVLQSRPVLHELLITAFVFVTTPVTLMLLTRATMHRDKTDDSRQLPTSTDLY